jgi:hypothetical protein
MITPSPASKGPEISLLDWAGEPEQCPAWIGFPTRTGLPADLKWSGPGLVPAIGARVVITMNSFGPALVKAYFHAEGYLGVICAPDQLPAWYQKQSPGVTMGHFFGRELEAVEATAPATVPPAASVPELTARLTQAQNRTRILQERQDIDRKYYRAKVREAAVAYPHAQDGALREQYSADARRALQQAIERTDAARLAELAAEQALTAAQAPGPTALDDTDWIPEYPPKEGED